MIEINDVDLDIVYINPRAVSSMRPAGDDRWRVGMMNKDAYYVTTKTKDKILTVINKLK